MVYFIHPGCKFTNENRDKKQWKRGKKNQHSSQTQRVENEAKKKQSVWKLNKCWFIWCGDVWMQQEQVSTPIIFIIALLNSLSLFSSLFCCAFFLARLVKKGTIFAFQPRYMPLRFIRIAASSSSSTLHCIASRERWIIIFDAVAAAASQPPHIYNSSHSYLLHDCFLCISHHRATEFETNSQWMKHAYTPTVKWSTESSNSSSKNKRRASFLLLFIDTCSCARHTMRETEKESRISVRVRLNGNKVSQLN